MNAVAPTVADAAEDDNNDAAVVVVLVIVFDVILERLVVGSDHAHASAGTERLMNWSFIGMRDEEDEGREEEVDATVMPVRSLILRGPVPGDTCSSGDVALFTPPTM